MRPSTWCGHAGDHGARRRAEPVDRPVPAHEFVIAADAAGADDDDRRRQFERADDQLPERWPRSTLEGSSTSPARRRWRRRFGRGA
jgi:hypothetical protein